MLFVVVIGVVVLLLLLLLFFCPVLGRMFRCFILVSDFCSEQEMKLM